MKFYTNIYCNGSNILCREISNGVRKDDVDLFSASLFIPTDKNTTKKTIDFKNVEEITFNSTYEIQEFKNTYDNVASFDIHGDIGVEYQYIANNYGNEFDYDFNQLKTLYIDIETTCDDGFPEILNPTEKVIAVTCMINNAKTVFCLGQFESTDSNTEVMVYEDEKELLYDLISYFQNEKPDIITGWNIRFFDIPYLVNRIRFFEDSELSYKKLSPWNIVKEKKVTKGEKEHTIYELVGISTLDYYELYKTFTYTNQESYKLDHIAWVELGERKISYSEYDNISDFYKNNFQKFIEYNIKDVELVERLEQKMKLMELAVALAYSAGVNFNDVFSQVRTWDVIIYNHLRKKNIVVPPKKKSDKDNQYAGAYVKEPIVGMHNWVVSFDISSMYPSTIMQYNISPETLVEQYDIHLSVLDIISSSKEVDAFYKMMVDNNLSITANGTCYTKTKHGFLPELMDKMYKDRKTFKKEMLGAKKRLEEINEELKRRGLKT
jgi:DNA polymerase elongation subunit (family B)